MDAKRKFIELLRELFQFDMSDLDFGIYRILNLKRALIQRWIEEDLPKAIQEELRKGALAEQAEAQKALEDARQKVLETLGEDAIDAEGHLAEPYRDTKVGREYLEAQEKAAHARPAEALEAAVYNHLYTFFSRYWQDGDFISRRRYSKKERYAIPYNGEEVYLYWANHDQYYIKTAEHFTDYTWKAPHNVTVHFKLQAADVEVNNVKGEKRFFIPVLDGISWDEQPPLPRGERDGVRGVLTIPFHYRPLTEQEKITYGKSKQQEKIIEETLAQIPARLKGNPEVLAALSAERRRDAKGNPVSYLAHHLRQYTARNTRDFFIHKDLKGFLSRELDFYLKNEVLNLDELEAAGEDLAEGWFQLMRLIKRIGNHIIDFLAQIEDFQKALWEKKKFVTETFYCITVGNIPEEFYPEIAENEAQWEEWQKLFGIEPPPLAHQGEDRGMTSPSTSTQEIGSRDETPNPSPLWGEGRGEGRKSRTKEERSELLMQLAREMRKAPTDAEQRLWYFLRNRRLGGYKFRRQHSIGPYIVDFVCIEKGVIVEVDGGQHAEDLQRRKDVERTRFLENRGFRVIRFWNHEVLKNTEEVLAAILDALDAPHPGPLPEGERGIEECANGIPEGERGIEKRANALLEGEREKIEERIAFLMAHPTLVLDTRHFPQDFTDRLLAAFDNLDEMTDGLLIHSENWQALNLLLEKYRERVKVIYIDPPYNTSNDGFLYRDNYWHSSWLAMMYDRLALGREWMREDGAIFISIDDNEIHHLRNVLDGFGDRIGTFVWEKKKKGSHLSHTFRDLTEYVLSYTPNISRIGELYGEEAYSNKWQPLIKRHNVERELRFPAGKIKSELKDGKYTPAIYGQGETAIHLLDPIIVKDGVIVNRFRMRARFVWTQETLNREINLGSQIKLSKNMRPNVLRADQEEKTKRPPSLITKDIAAYEDAFAELKNIFGDVIYAYPKPTGLVNFIVKALTYFKPQGIILDYFAGSGTTGHAVINLNREDGGRRKFILVEMGEYFDTVLLPRIKKVTFAPEWKNGRPLTPTLSPEGRGSKSHTPTLSPQGTGSKPLTPTLSPQGTGSKPLTPTLSPQGRGSKGEGWIERSPRVIKVIRLESYEDALNNIAFDEESGQQALALYGDEYLLRYMLRWEAKKSETLLDVKKLQSPFSYKLRIHRDGETREQAVDLPETFNYLIGLDVEKRMVYSPSPQPSHQYEYGVNSSSQPSPHRGEEVNPSPQPSPHRGEGVRVRGKYLVYRGTTRDGRKVCVIWRETKGWTEEDYQRDAEFVQENGLVDGVDEVFVNGDSVIPGARSLDGVFKARLFGQVEG